MDRLEKICVDKGMRMTDQRRVIARVLSIAADHPDVEEIHRRATEIARAVCGVSASSRQDRSGAKNVVPSGFS